MEYFNTSRNLKRTYLFLLYCVTWAKLIGGQIPIKDNIDILFIGNSLIGAKNGGLPAYIQACLEQNNENSFSYSFVPNWGKSLEDHWNENYVESCTLRAKNKIKEGGWEIVKWWTRLEIYRSGT